MLIHTIFRLLALSCNQNTGGYIDMNILFKATLALLILLLSGCAHHRNYYGQSRQVYYPRSGHVYSDSYYYDRDYYDNGHSHSRNRNYAKPSKHAKPYNYRSSRKNNINPNHLSSKPSKHQKEYTPNRSYRQRNPTPFSTERSNRTSFPTNRQRQKQSKSVTNNSFSSPSSFSRDKPENNTSFSNDRPSSPSSGKAGKSSSRGSSLRMNSGSKIKLK